MDQINDTKVNQGPKKNRALFLVLAVIILLIIVGVGYALWKTKSNNQIQNNDNQKQINQNGQNLNNELAKNQSVLNIFGQIEAIEGQNITIRDGNTDQTMTFAWSANITISKENSDSQGFSKINFSELKKGQTINIMYQNNELKTPLSMVLMGGTNLLGEVLEITDDKMQVKSQQDTFSVTIDKQTNILRLGANGKMEDKLPVTEIKKGNLVSVVAESISNDKTYKADKIEILPQEK